MPETPYTVIWGGGMHIEYIFKRSSFFQSDNNQYAIVDSDVHKQGKAWRGIPIYSPGALKSVDWSVSKLVISSYGSQEKIKEAALKLNIPSEKIHSFYDSVQSY
jgi:hypothetical protein